jgi:hypothetical protein
MKTNPIISLNRRYVLHIYIDQYRCSLLPIPLFGFDTQTHATNFLLLKHYVCETDGRKTVCYNQNL